MKRRGSPRDARPGFKGALALAASCSVAPGLVRLQKSLPPGPPHLATWAQRIFSRDVAPGRASCRQAPRAPRARPLSPGPRSSRGQSRCRRALCRPLPEAPASSQSGTPAPRSAPPCDPSRGDGSVSTRTEKGGKVRITRQGREGCRNDRPPTGCLGPRYLCSAPAWKNAEAGGPGLGQGKQETAQGGPGSRGSAGKVPREFWCGLVRCTMRRGEAQRKGEPCLR